MKRSLIVLAVMLMLLGGCGSAPTGGANTTTQGTTTMPTSESGAIAPTSDTTAADPSMPTSAPGAVAPTTDAAMPDTSEIGDAAFVLANDERFSTLANAITAAGMTETLRGVGPYTIFAPNNEAFAAISSDQLQSLLSDPAALRQLLEYHVVSGSVRSSDLEGQTSLPTLGGKSITITADGSDLMLDGGTRFVTKDIETTNGIIHEIDAILMPTN